MKKALSLLLVLAMVLSMVPAVFAEEAEVETITSLDGLTVAAGETKTVTYAPAESCRLDLEMTGDAAISIDGTVVMDPVIEVPVPDENEGAFDYYDDVTGEYTLDVIAGYTYTIVLTGGDYDTKITVADITYPGEVADYPIWYTDVLFGMMALSGTLTIPANTTVYYGFNARMAGKEATFTNADGIAVNGVAAVDGKLAVELAVDENWVPVYHGIANTTDADITVNVVIADALGTSGNPAPAEVSKAAAFSATADAPEYNAYYYAVTTLDDGYIEVTSTSDNADVSVDGTAYEAPVAVVAGNTYVVAVGAADWSAAKIPFTVAYVADKTAAELDAAAAVTAQIKALYTFNMDTLSNELTGTEDEIKAAQAAYEALSDSAKAYVDADTKTKLDNAVATLPAYEPYNVVVSGIALDMASELFIQAKFLLPEELRADAGAVMNVTFNGSTTSYNVVDKVAEGLDSSNRIVLIQPIPSPYMDKTVTISIVDGNGYPVTFTDKATGNVYEGSFTYGIETYMDQLYSLNSSGKYDKTFDAIAALLTYGSYAQAYFTEKNLPNISEEPASNLLSKYGLAPVDLSGFDIANVTQDLAKDDAKFGISINGGVPNLDASIYMTVQFNNANVLAADDVTVSLSYYEAASGKTHTFDSLETSIGNKNRILVDVENVAAALFDCEYSLTVTNNETGEKYNCEYSIFEYLRVCINLYESDASKVNSVNLYKAMYYYNQAANALFETQA